MTFLITFVARLSFVSICIIVYSIWAIFRELAVHLVTLQKNSQLEPQTHMPDLFAYITSFT